MLSVPTTCTANKDPVTKSLSNWLLSHESIDNTMIKTENFEKVHIDSAEDLREWLTEHHAQEESVWSVTYKKSVPNKYVSREEVLDELLCFGWIDGIRRKLDTDRTMQAAR